MKYWAFLSYSHQDNVETRVDGSRGHVRWAEWLHNALETFRVPAEFRARQTRAGEAMPERFYPVFQDEKELPINADLADSIRTALRESRFLIVICSPRSATSRYVNEEVRYFKELNRQDRIMTLMIDGEPNVSFGNKAGLSPDAECFCPALRHPLDAQNQIDVTRTDAQEPIAGDVRIKDSASTREPKRGDLHAHRSILEYNKLKLLAGLMGVGFDELVHRDRERQLREERAKARRLRKLVAAFAVLALIAAIAGAVAFFKEREATRARDKALVAQSRFLADLSNQLAARGDHTSALLLAMEALPDSKTGVTRPLVPEAQDALYQNLATLREVKVLSAEPTKIRLCVVAGNRLFTFQADGVVRVWDAKSYQPLATHGPFGEEATALPNPSGERIIIVEKDRSVNVIDAISGQKAWLPLWQSRVIAGIVDGTILGMSADWRYVVTRPQTFVEIDSNTGLERKSVHLESGGGEKAGDFSFSNNGARVVDSAGAVWDTSTGKVIAKIDLGADTFVTNVRLSPDGTKVVWQSYATAFIYDVATGTRRQVQHPESQKIKAHERAESNITSTAFTSDSRWLATGSADKTARIWDVATGDLITVLDGHRGEVRSVEFLPGDRRLVTRSDDGTVRIWAAIGDSEILPPARFQGKIIGSFYRKGAVWLVALEEDGSITVWDYTNNKLLTTLKGHRIKRYSPTTSRAYLDPEGRRLITATDDHTARIWNLETGAEISHIEVNPDSSMIYDIGLSRDGRIAYATADAIYVWEVETGRLLHVLGGGSSIMQCECASFNPDGTEIVAARTGETEIWNVNDGHRVRVLTKDWLDCARFSPDGRRIATIPDHGEEVRILDAHTGALLATLKGHENLIDNLEYSPDGRFILTHSEDSTARLWDAETGKQLRVLTDIGGMFSAHFTPDGRKVITESGGPAFLKGLSQTETEPWRGRLWPMLVDTSAMIARAKEVAARALTHEQRVQAFLDPEPPKWNVEMEKWPYQTQEWKDWLRFQSDKPPLPDSPEWKTWLAAHRRNQ